jgi:hypothetical protein
VGFGGGQGWKRFSIPASCPRGSSINDGRRGLRRTRHYQNLLEIATTLDFETTSVPLP